MLVRIIKTAQTEAASAALGSWETWVQGAENSATLPIDYEIVGELLNSVRLGEPMVAWRHVRNGVQKPGLLVSSPVVELLVTTLNSRYRVTVTRESGALRALEPAITIELVGVALGVQPKDVADWIFRFGARGTAGDILGAALQRLTAIIAFTPCFGGPQPFQRWLRTSNELLAGNSPLDCLVAGRLEEVAEFLADGWSGQPT